MQYKHRYRKQYKGVALDIKAHDLDELADKVAAAKAKIDEDSIDSTMSVSLWAKKWYSTYKQPNISKRTSSDYKTRLNRHFLPCMGKMKISDVRQIHLQEFLNDYASETTTGRVRKMYQMLNQMFKAARANGLIRYNPAEDLIVPKGRPDRHGRALTRYEKEILLKVCEYHPDGPWALTMLYSGLRPGETHRILGKHIQGRYLYVDGTKTDRSKRFVPAPPITLSGNRT